MDPNRFAPRTAGRTAARLAGLLLALAALLFPDLATGYADRAGTDIVMDAPWRTVRDEIPVLFFMPQLEGGRHIERLRIFECVGGVPVGPAVFVDAAGGPDTLNGATIVGMFGEPRGGIEADERIASFWHYVVRLPHALLAHHADPDIHFLLAEVDWSKPGLLHRRHLRNTRMLRVVVDPRRFPSLGAGDRYLDTHVHTIAEQTTSGMLDVVDGGHKAYAGPLVMLLESAYALGLVETRPGPENWPDFVDSVVVTDHNVFYSTRPFEVGTPPREGPTSATDGAAGEAAWYREHLGRLAGEEVTLRRGSNQDGSPRPNIGHHLLVYGGPHFEGPWHGGYFLTSRLENPNTLEHVLAGLKAAGGRGFVYAAHPDLQSFEWPPEYYAQGAGFAPYDSRDGPQVDSAGTEFLFKGLELWNSKIDAANAGGFRLAASSAFDRMNPFAGGPAKQRFIPREWDAELWRSLDTLYTLIGRGLAYSFREAPEEKFIRKLYLSGGSDAHGDFNYTDEVVATAVPWSGRLNPNAFARVRTLVLVHDQPVENRDVVAAFAEGNTVATDGPLLSFSLDANGRDDPGAGAGRWHDAECGWENADGRLGGSGRFDGGRTALVALPGGDTRIRTEWRRSVTPGAGDLASARFDRIFEAGRDSFRLALGPEGARDDRALPVAMDRLSAIVAVARDTVVDERCLTNPVWVAPVGIEVAAQPVADEGHPDGVLPPGALRVVFRFPFSMSPSAGSRVLLRPLGADGRSTDPVVELVPDPGWEEADGIASSVLSATNADPLSLPAGDWDAGDHAPRPGIASFVVWLERPAELHGNVLNDVARAFAVPRAAPATEPVGR